MTFEGPQIVFWDLLYVSLLKFPSQYPWETHSGPILTLALRIHQQGETIKVYSS